MAMRYSKTSLSVIVLTAALALSACGGGDGGGEAAPTGTTPTGTAPAGNTTARTGTMVYVRNSELLAVDMASGTTRLLVNTLGSVGSNRDFAGASVGPAREFALSYNTATPLSNIGFITILNPDGSQERSLTVRYMFKGPPYLSPDGSKIMFDASFYPGSLPNRRFVQAVSRTGENLFFYSDFSFPLWMPDGRVLLSGKDGLYIGEAKIGGQAVLIPNSQNTGNYSVSPDRKKIAFVRRAAAGAPRHVYMMNIDGTGTRQVTNSKTSEEIDVSFSPDGNSLMVTTSGCISVFNSFPYAIGDVDSDLIHVIPASASMLDILDVANLSGTALQRENGASRCTDGTLSWR
jgi:WD40-like Beta Propeller Repeat